MLVLSHCRLSPEWGAVGASTIAEQAAVAGWVFFNDGMEMLICPLLGALIWRVTSQESASMCIEGDKACNSKKP